MARIAFIDVTVTVMYGGIQTAVWRLADALARAGHEIAVFGGDAQHPAGEPASRHYRAYFPVPSARKSASISAAASSASSSAPATRAMRAMPSPPATTTGPSSPNRSISTGRGFCPKIARHVLLHERRDGFLCRRPRPVAGASMPGWRRASSMPGRFTRATSAGRR